MCIKCPAQRPMLAIVVIIISLEDWEVLAPRVLFA